MVFSDVDSASVTSLQFFDLVGLSLGTFLAPSIAGNETFSFLGVRFDAGEQVGRVRITAGNQVLAPGNLSTDLVTMDDFIYGEPTATAVPEPTSLLLLGTGGLGLIAAMRRRKKQAQA